MNLFTILFLGSSALSGIVTLSIGLVNLPQPTTSYTEGSGETAQTVAEKNTEIVLQSRAFKETMIGAGLIMLFIISLSWVKYREEQLRIIDEIKELNKSPVQQLVPKSAELDSKNKQTPINKPIQVEHSPALKPQNLIASSNQDTVLDIQRQTTYPKPILKNVGFATLSVKKPIKVAFTNPSPNPYYPYPRPYNAIYRP